MISFLKRLNEKRFLTTHKFFARFNISWGGADACIRAGCEKYCGHNLNENLFFYLHRDFKKRMEEHESRAKSILEDVEYKFEGDNQMTQNEKLRNQAVEMLKDLDLTGAESLEVSNERFNDGSTQFRVSVSYPATKKEERAGLSRLNFLGILDLDEQRIVSGRIEGGEINAEVIVNESESEIIRNCVIEGQRVYVMAREGDVEHLCMAAYVTACELKKSGVIELVIEYEE